MQVVAHDAASLVRGLAAIADHPLRGKEKLELVLESGTYYLSAPLLLTGAHSGSREAPVHLRASGEVLIVGGPRLVTAASTDPVTVAHQQPVYECVGADQRWPVVTFPTPSADPSRAVWAHRSEVEQVCAEAAHVAGAVITALHERGWGAVTSLVQRGSGDQGATSWVPVGDNQRGLEINEDFVRVAGLAPAGVDLLAGQWRADQEPGKISWRPTRAGDWLAAAVLPQLLVLQGKSDAPVHDVVIEGLRFTGTAPILDPAQFSPITMSDWALVRAGALDLVGTQAVQIRNCEFVDLGGHAVHIGGNSRDIVVERCRFTGSGGSDVLVLGDDDARRDRTVWSSYRADGETKLDLAPGPASEGYPRDVVIRDNEFSFCGRRDLQAAAVGISVAQRVEVSHNRIHSGPRSGITICDGTFGGHRISGNVLHSLVLETDDHGPINAWGRDRFWVHGRTDAQRRALMPLDVLEETLIANNLIHHSGAWGIDLDDGSSRYRVTGNVLLGCGVKLREGYDRTVADNTFVGGAVHAHMSYETARDHVVGNTFMGSVAYRFIQGEPEISESCFESNRFCWPAGTGDPAGATPHRDQGSVWDSPAATETELRARVADLPVDDEILTRLSEAITLAQTDHAVDLAYSSTLQWRDHVLAPLDTIEVASSAGLAVGEGIYVVSGHWPLSPGDVILRADGNSVAGIALDDDLLARLSAARELRVWRGQREIGWRRRG